MKEYPKAFLAKYFQEPIPDQDLANYVQELHEYLWRFVRAEFPWANGNLKDYISNAAQSAEYRRTKDDQS